MHGKEEIRWKMKSSAFALLQPEFKELFQDSVLLSDEHELQTKSTLATSATTSNHVDSKQDLPSLSKEILTDQNDIHVDINTATSFSPKTLHTQNFNSEQTAQRLNWHLRKKRADLFIDLQSSAAYLAGLRGFLQSKGLHVLPYDAQLHYLPYDLILCDRTRIPHEGKYCILDSDKRMVWEFLKQNFPEKL